MAKQVTTRRGRALAAKRPKKPTSKSETSIATPTAPAPTIVMPSVRKLLQQSYTILWSHKKLFAGITAIYCLLAIILAGSISGLNVAGIRDQAGNRVLGSFSAYSQLLGSTNSAQESAGAYQSLLFLVASLAIIWALRQVYAGNQIRIRDAYYKGMQPFITASLVIIVMILQLIPFIVGSGLFQLVVSNGIATTPLEYALWGLLAIALTLVSFYFWTASLFGLYIVTLPDTTPIQALKLARKLVARRRWSVLRKLLVLPLAIVVLSALLLVPTILLIPPVAVVATALVGPVLVLFSHSYLYALYRGLMNE